ncbi:hypothetical protein CGCFRS4_v015526 [Colletotrichum fructicola]|nr:hypothetical protein CGCFRS4_v015526 [Colletotrichum fructicola]
MNPPPVQQNILKRIPRLQHPHPRPPLITPTNIPTTRLIKPLPPPRNDLEPGHNRPLPLHGPPPASARTHVLLPYIHLAPRAEPVLRVAGEIHRQLRRDLRGRALPQRAEFGQQPARQRALGVETDDCNLRVDPSQPPGVLSAVCGGNVDVQCPCVAPDGRVSHKGLPLSTCAGG